MPIFMDLHIAPGVSAREVAEAHILDTKIQHKYCCRAMTYWMDEDKGNVFCLIEAPDKDSVRAMHEQAHGLIPHEIIQVNTDVVRAFLGRIHDPEIAAEPETNLKVFSDPAFRVILVTKTTDARLLQHQLGKERAQELLLLYSGIVREQARIHHGSEVYLKEDGFVLSFTSSSEAVACALDVQKSLPASASVIGLRMGIHGGVPVSKSESLFGTAVRFAGFLCSIGLDSQVILSNTIRNLYKGNDFLLSAGKDKVRSLAAVEETFLETLIETLASNWHNPEFDVPDFCKTMSISKPQLYRKCVAVAGMSPNNLLREYRLQRALEFLRDQDKNISQTTFDTGFSSPSYFTKCFQKRFGLQPLAYMKGK